MISGSLFPYSTAAPDIISANHLDQHEWDALVSDDDFFHSHGWLTGLDYALGPGEVLAVKGKSGLLGGCALWAGEKTPGLFSLQDFFPGLSGPWNEEFLWGGARRSTHNEIPCIRGRYRSKSLATIAAALADLAEQRRKAAVVIPYMPLSKAREIASSYPNARVLMHSAEAAVDVTPGGLGAVLNRVGQHRRRRINAELAAFRRMGIRIEWHPLQESLFEIAAQLIANNREKYGNNQGPEWILRLLDGQKNSSVTDNAVAAVAKLDNRIIGICIIYRFGKKFHFRFYGSDYTFENNDFRYFALTFYYPLDYAAEHGITQNRLSIAALQAKTLRGAMIEPLAALLLFNRNPEISIEECKHYNRNFLRIFQDRYAKYLNHEWQFLTGGDEYASPYVSVQTHAKSP